MPRRQWTPPQVPFTRTSCGVSDNALYASIRRGTTAVLGPGVYIATAVLPTDEAELHQLAALAHQMRWPHVFASHETAALTHGLPLLDAAAVAKQQPRFSRVPGPGVRSTRSPRVSVRPLTPPDVTEVPAGLLQGLRLTAPARTAVDLAAELALPQALMLTDAVARQALAQFRGGVDNRELSYVARRAALRQLELAGAAPMVGGSRVAVALFWTDPLRESPAESGSFGWFVDSGMPVPRCQVVLATETGPARVDFFWEDFGLIGEVDGNVKYDGTFGANDAVLVQQHEREQALRNAGFVVVRWTAAEIFFRPAQVLERVSARLRGCGWSGDVSGGNDARRPQAALEEG